MNDPKPARTCLGCGHVVPQSNPFCGHCGANLESHDSINATDQLIGQVLGDRFRLLKMLGSGGMGAVYLAEHVGIGKRVAVKVLRAALREQADLVARFRREGLAVSKLQDAHTITVFDFGVWRGMVYLVMEFLPGVDLAEVLEKEGALPLSRVLRIAHQVCSSLAEAHSHGIIHRDLKPENIFVLRSANGDELIKVLDFGLAKFVEDAGASEESLNGPSVGRGGVFQTQVGTLLGTPYFMAPEQIKGEEVGPWTDLYALGVLIFRMLSGEYPYRGKTPLRVLEGHLSGTLPSFSEVVEGLSIPPAVELLVRRLMSRDPKARPASVLEVDEALLDLLTDSYSSSADLPQSSLTDLLRTVGSIPGLSLGVDLDAPTRAEFEDYERKLKRRGCLFPLVLTLLLLGAGAGAWRHLNQPPPPRTAEVEPNDESVQATLIEPGVKVRGFLGARRQRDRSDRDIFMLDVPSATPIAEARVSGVPGMDIVLECFDDQGALLAKIDAAKIGAGEAGRCESRTARLLLVIREVWVKDQPPSENSTDPYTLEVLFKAP
ncbi:serine/threonine protein kinase [Myxococcota bacterium]|nr:serine/threonine protein kinase [Myxococcota bacterium]